MSITVSKLRDIGIIDNQGNFQDIQSYSQEYNTVILRRLMKILSTISIKDYMSSHAFTPIFPECALYCILRDNYQKLVDLQSTVGSE